MMPWNSSEQDIMKWEKIKKSSFLHHMKNRERKGDKGTRIEVVRKLFWKCLSAPIISPSLLVHLSATNTSNHTRLSSQYQVVHLMENTITKPGWLLDIITDILCLCGTHFCSCTYYKDLSGLITNSVYFRIKTLVLNADVISLPTFWSRSPREVGIRL